MVIVDVDLSHLKRFGPAMPKIQQRGLQLVGMDLLKPLKRHSPVDQGLLRQWAIVSQSQSEVKIQSPAFYAKYQNDGTSPHMIRPKSKRALHWSGSMNMSITGNNISITGSKGGFSKGHMVGGIKGKKFVERSIQEVKPRIEQNFQVAINEVLG